MSDSLLKACAAINGADWEEMSFALDISEDDHTDIERSQSGVKIRRRKVLTLWKKQAKSPTVGKLLRLLTEANIGRSAIEKKYVELFGHC